MAIGDVKIIRKEDGGPDVDGEVSAPLNRADVLIIIKALADAYLSQ
jgi:hypothetical protein